MATKRKAAVKRAARKPAARKPAARRAAPRGVLAKASGEALRLAGIGTDAVARATGKAWDQWLAILDKAGAIAMPHKAIASLLAGIDFTAARRGWLRPSKSSGR